MDKKTQRLFITDRDLEVLKFLWRWKLLSTAALAKAFFHGASAFTAYQRLLLLERKRYIRHVSFRYQGGGAWTLDTAGFRFLLSYLPELQAHGFKSENPLHDYYATAFHLGEWLSHRPGKGIPCSEQELRSLPPDLLPRWVPKGAGHRPDGYTVFDRGSGAHLYAFECELSQKSRVRYDEIMAFYGESETIAATFWLVGSAAIEGALKRSIGNAARPERHHFVRLDDFKRLGWSARLMGGHFQGKSLADLLLDRCPTVLPLSSDCSDIAALLQSQKRPILPNEKRAARAFAPSD